jgi:hypothetical protein
VTVIVAVTVTALAFMAVKGAIFPEPEAGNPIEGVLFVQLYTTPATLFPEKLTAGVKEPLQILVIFAIAFKVGVGLTVIVNCKGVPGQPFAVGVTVIVAINGVVPVFWVGNETNEEPDPLAARPMAVLSLVHVKVVPATGLVNVTAAVFVPLQRTWFATGFTVGVGLTVTVKILGVPGQPL